MVFVYGEELHLKYWIDLYNSDNTPTKW